MGRRFESMKDVIRIISVYLIIGCIFAIVFIADYKENCKTIQTKEAGLSVIIIVIAWFPIGISDIKDVMFNRDATRVNKGESKWSCK